MAQRQCGCSFDIYSVAAAKCDLDFKRLRAVSSQHMCLTEIAGQKQSEKDLQVAVQACRHKRKMRSERAHKSRKAARVSRPPLHSYLAVRALKHAPQDTPIEVVRRRGSRVVAGARASRAGDDVHVASRAGASRAEDDMHVQQNRFLFCFRTMDRRSQPATNPTMDLSHPREARGSHPATARTSGAIC